MNGYSIVLRLVMWLTLSTILFWGTAAALGAYVMRDEFGEIFDSAMKETAARLLPLALDDVQDGDIPVMPRRLRKSDGDGYLTYQVRHKDGTVLMHSYETPPAPFRAPLAEGFWQGDGMRVFTISADGATVFVQVADSLAHRTEAVKDSVLAQSLPLVGLVPLSVVVLLFIIRRAMAPLSGLGTAIAEKDSGNLSPLETEDLPGELEPIAHTLNIVLARLAAALSAEREFAANSAHELRTPIAGALAQSQLLIDELGASPGAGRAALIEQSLIKLTGLTEKLLQLSRADAGIGLSGTPRDLVPIIDMVVEDMRRHFGPACPIHILKQGSAKLVRPVNPDAVAIVLRNLIENAVLHGETGSPVSVRVDGHEGITVANRARMLSGTELARVRQRFHRIDDGSSGSGLGLPIVERLLSQINASLELKSHPTDDGSIFEAVIRFV